MKKKPQKENVKKITHDNEIGNNPSKVFQSDDNATDSKHDFNNRFQIQDGNFDKGDNLLE